MFFREMVTPFVSIEYLDRRGCGGTATKFANRLDLSVSVLHDVGDEYLSIFKGINASIMIVWFTYSTTFS
jgi:hypothetical protein